MAVLSWWGAPGGLRAEEHRSLAISVGVFDVGALEAETGGLEVRFPLRSSKLEGAGGFYFTSDDGYFVFAGLLRDFSLAGGWVLSPAFGVALYEPGEGIDLGGPVEFRSALEIGYQLERGHRAGFAVVHLSNSAIYTVNPGSNSLILSYSVPIGRR